MRTRQSVVFYVNEKRYEVFGQQTLMNLSDFLRYEQSLTGTKVVCAEGDCGACTVLKASVQTLNRNHFVFKSVNSCIMPVLSLDGCQLVTVEGLKKESSLHPVQKSMIENFGSQCGFCTPGFVCAMAGLVEDSILEKKAITEKRTKNYLTGNLCRCTGYDPILKSALAINLSQVETLQDRYHDSKKIAELKALVQKDVEIQAEGFKIFLPTTLKRALELKKKFTNTKIVAGATDLGVMINKGRYQYDAVMSLQNIESMSEVKKTKDFLIVPSRVTLADLQKDLSKEFPEMEKMLNIFASPQIKNSGTLVGNLVNASPISDTIPFLMVVDALIEVKKVGGKRLIPIDEFFLGYKTMDLKPQEIVTAIHIPLKNAQKKTQVLKLYKVSVRKDLDISAVTLAARIKLKGQKIEEARLAFGGVGPIVARLKKIEQSWLGQELRSQLLSESANEIPKVIQPLSDVRGSKEYRLLLCQNLLKKMANELEVNGVPAEFVV